MIDSLKTNLKNGEVVLGAFVGFPSPSIVRYVAGAGFDFAIIDTEHGPMDIESTGSLVIAAEAAGILPIVRVASNDRSMIMRALDVGARGIQVPQIDSQDDVRRAVQYSKFAPLGSRGLALSVRANRFGAEGVREYIEHSNEETLVIAQIESAKGIENLPEILAVDGIDVIFVGPVDLSHSLGIPGEFANRRFVLAVDEVIARTKAAGKVLGMFVGNPGDARKWIDRGARYICTGTNGLIDNACQSFIRGVRNVGA